MFQRVCRVASSGRRSMRSFAANGPIRPLIALPKRSVASVRQQNISKTIAPYYKDSAVATGASGATSSAEGKRTSTGLQAQLRKLYKLVHPDLFGAHPAAKTANEQSLQRLMGLVERIRKQPGGSAFAAPEQHSLVFFVRAAGGEPREVRAELPLNSGWPALQKALTGLFATAGVPQPGAWQLEPQRAGDELLLDGPERPLSLHQFLRQFAPAAAARRLQQRQQRRELRQLQRQVEEALAGAVLWHAEGSYLDEASHADRVRVLLALLALAPSLRQRALLAGVLIRFDAGLGTRLQFRPVPRYEFRAPPDDDDRHEPTNDDADDELDAETAAGAERAVLCLDPSQTPEQWAAFIDLELPTRLSAQNWARASPPPPPPTKQQDPAAVLAAQQRLAQHEQRQKQQAARNKAPLARPPGAGRNSETVRAQELALRAQTLLGVHWLSFDLTAEGVGARLWEEPDLGRGAEADHLEHVRETDPEAFARHMALLQGLLVEPQAGQIRVWLKQQARAVRAWRKVVIMLREFTPPKLAHVHEVGVLFLSTHLAPARLLPQLAELAPEALARAQLSAQRLDAFQFLEKRLGARSVGAERRLWALHGRAADALVADALGRLTRAADSLRPLGLAQQSLVLGDRYAVGEDGALVFPFDFELEAPTDPRTPVRRLAKPAPAN